MEWTEGNPCHCQTLRHHVKVVFGTNSAALAELDRLLAEVERLRGLLEELDSFRFLVYHKAGCGEPCDCGWENLERRISVELRAK